MLQKGFAIFPVIIIVVLVVGAIISLRLIQSPQIFAPKAATTNPFSAAGAGCAGTTPLINLSWPAHPATQEFLIYRNQVLLSQFIGTSFTDRSGQSGQTYTYYVQPLVVPNDNRYPGWEPVSVVAPNCPQAPPLPGAFTLNTPETFCSGTNSHVKLSWSAAANGPTQGMGGYLVFVNGGSAGQYNSLTNTTLTDPAPRAYGQQFAYMVKAVTNAGVTESNTVNVTAKDCTSVPVVPSPSVTVQPSPSAVKTGDINSDGKVDITDFNNFVTTFGQQGTNLPSDLNHDGKVDIFDFNILVSNFGK